MIDLVIASSNLHKVREIKSLVKPLSKFDVFSIIELIKYLPPDENGSTFEENAIIKAKNAASLLKKWVIADDSGIIVPALNGEPGLYSARYAGEEATDKDNRKKLLNSMKKLSDIQRSAYFETCIALAAPDGTIKAFNGKCEGTIALKERGGNGFGYDPIFIKNDYNMTFGELDEKIKNKISARGKAFAKLLIYLESL